jgi:hypothetical protein
MVSRSEARGRKNLDLIVSRSAAKGRKVSGRIVFSSAARGRLDLIVDVSRGAACGLGDERFRVKWF